MALTWRFERPVVTTIASASDVFPIKSMAKVFSALASSSVSWIIFSRFAEESSSGAAATGGADAGVAAFVIARVSFNFLLDPEDESGSP